MSSSVSPTVLFATLGHNCSQFEDFTKNLLNGDAGKDSVFNWAHFLVATGHAESAKELFKSSSEFEESDSDYVDNYVQSHAENPIPPTRCRTFGCSESKIAECHAKVLYNKAGEPSNSPDFHIQSHKLEKMQNKMKFEDMRDEIYETYNSGDKSAHLDESYMKVVAQLKIDDPQAYEGLIADYKSENIPVTAFKTEVEKLAREFAKSSKSNTPTLEVELPKILKPFAVGLEGKHVLVGEDGGYHEVRETSDSVITIPHSNFVAKIDRVKVIDDGIEQVKYFDISGLANGDEVLPTVTVPAKDFARMQWVWEWGNKAIFNSSYSKDIVRYAVQTTSKNAEMVIFHYQNGIDFDGDKHSYFYPNGVIGESSKNTTDIAELQGYGFPPVKDIAPIEECYESVKTFLDVVANPQAKGVPLFLLSFALLSPLMDKLKSEGIEVTFLGWLMGKTGSLKTSLSLVLLNFFGRFTNPTATFADTITSIERQLYLAKDSLLILDDFHPAVSYGEKRAKEALASKVIRSVGDRTGKRRAKSNLKMNKTYNPRGNVLITGEDIVAGHSSNSRLMVVELGFGDIDTDKLSYLQDNGHLLNSFTYHYIRHLLDTVYNAEGVNLKDEFTAYRDEASNANRHKRFASAVSLLQLSWNHFLMFFRHVEAITDEEYETMKTEGWNTFLGIASAQNARAQSEDAVSKYMSALREMIFTKQIATADKSAPSHLSAQNTIIYHDAENYYLVPQATFAKVNEFLIRKGDFLGISDFTLRKMLADRDCLVKSPEGDHLTTKIRVGTSQIRVLQIPKRILDMF